MMNAPDIVSIQRLRRQRTMYAMGTGASLSAVMIMLYWRGNTRLDAVSLCIGMLIFWPANLSFVAMIISGANLRLRDQSMTFAMMLWGTVSSFAWAYFVDDGRHLVIMVYLLAMMLGAFRLRLAQYLQITALALALYAVVIAALAHNHPQSVSLLTEAMNWFVFLLVMLGFSLLGGESSQVRALLQSRNRELRDARDSATVANQAKSRFLARTSHELRTPLSTILGATEVIGSHMLPTQEADALQRARRAGLYLLSLVNSMIDLSQLESGSLVIRTARSDLYEELHIVREIMQARAEHRGLQLHVDTNLSSPFNVEMDSMRIREVLVHLINNSINFTDEGAVTVRANCLVQQDKFATVEFGVTDTGRGMTPTQTRRLFEAPDPEHGAAGSDEAGPGLGLGMCQKLIRLMGGNIEVQSMPGSGSTMSFTLTLPFGEIGDARYQPNGTLAQPRNCRILIVDDAPDNRMLLQVFLKDQAADIDCAEDGVEALALFKSHRYDIVLMDMHMPRMNGIDTTIAMREFEITRGRSGSQRAAILAITADDSDNDQRRSMQAGCDTHLVKPVSRAALLNNLRLYHKSLRPRS